MARILGLLPSALAAVARGGSASAWYRELRAEGLAPRRSEALELFRIAKGITVNSADEPFRDISSAPSGTEMGQWPTKSATGVIQTVTLLYRDRATGQIHQTWYNYKSDNGVSREEAMSSGITAYAEHAEQYEQDLIGAIHSSARRLVPIGAGL